MQAKLDALAAAIAALAETVGIKIDELTAQVNAASANIASPPAAPPAA